MKIFILICLGFLVIFFLLILYNYHRKKKLLADIRKNWGKGTKTAFSFAKIAIYHEAVMQRPCFQILTGEQITDLNLHAVFEQADMTCSKCGQQYLYHRLLAPLNDAQELSAWDKAVDYFSAQPVIREKLQLALLRLEKSESYYLPQLFFSPPQKKPGYLVFVPVLIALLLFSVIMLFFDPSYIVLLLGVIVADFILHYVNKKELGKYMFSFKSLEGLFALAASIAKLELPILDCQRLKKELNAVAPLRRYLAIINLQVDSSSDLTAILFALIENIKIIFLLDISIFYRCLKSLVALSENIHYLYRCIGFIDAAIAIAGFRKSLPWYAKPVFVPAAKHLVVERAYHPLVPECIPNNLTVAGQGVLITGSNMSGKTTFIRTIALNALFAQTLATCFAAHYEAPIMQIHSSIAVSDQLLAGKSYYLKELERIHTLVRAADGPVQCLFIIDECFKGTNTIERIAAAREVLAYLNKNEHIVLIATHDIELSHLLGKRYGLYHFSEVIEDNNLNFDFLIKPGMLTTRNAIQLLEIFGYPPAIVEGARNLSRELKFAGLS